MPHHSYREKTQVREEVEASTEWPGRPIKPARISSPSSFDLHSSALAYMTLRFQPANLDVAVPHGVAMILQQDVAFGGFAETLRVFELALGDVLFQFLAAALEFEDLDAVQPVLNVVAFDNDARVVEFAGRFELLVFARGDQVVERRGGAITGDSSFGVGMVFVIQ